MYMTNCHIRRHRRYLRDSIWVHADCSKKLFRDNLDISLLKKKEYINFDGYRSTESLARQLDLAKF